MRSLEEELGLVSAQSGFSYFDYVEQKLNRSADTRDADTDRAQTEQSPAPVATADD